MQTLLTERLGIRHPVISAPLGRGSTARYLGAVANAGAFGFVALLHMEEAEVAQTLSPIIQATGGRFGVNLTLVVDQRRRLQSALDAGVRYVSFWQAEPDDYISIAKARGATVFWIVGSPQEARRARDLGVDFLICQGREAGGHLVGVAPLMGLLPAVVDAADGVPVIAAGGLADGRGLAAALMLGAVGVLMGTRFVASEECEVPAGYKQRIVQANLNDLVETTLFDGGWPDSPHRVIRNETVAAWEAAGSPPMGNRPGEGDTIVTLPDGSPLKRYNVSTPWPEMGDAWTLGPHYAGTSAGLVRDVEPVQRIIEKTVAEAEREIARHALHLKSA